MAEAATRYWRVQLTLHDAVSQAQRMEIPEGRYHPVVDHEDRSPILAKWREALVRQVLTPAPDANSGKWKQGGAGQRRPRIYRREARADRTRNR
jgi:hypothetical protein